MVWLAIMALLAWRSYEKPYLPPLRAQMILITDDKDGARATVRITNLSDAVVHEVHATVLAFDSHGQQICESPITVTDLAPRKSLTVTTKLDARVRDIKSSRVRLATEAEAKFRLVR